MNIKTSHTLLAIALGLGIQANAAASRISVTVENLTATGGVYFTPVWVGFHDGSFDTFDVGGAASASIEAIAEGGDASGIRTDFATAAAGTDDVIFAPDGFPGAPVFDPGDSASLVLDVDANSDRYFSFASMIIPSNDAFIGNDNATAYEIFDATGVFHGPLEILVLGNQVWDAGTEVNDGRGAAFSVLGGTSTDEMAMIGVHSGLGVLLGTDTVAGTTIDTIAGDFTQAGYQVARIRINQVPEPHLLAMFGLGLGLMRVVGRKRDSGSRLDGGLAA